MTKQYDLEVELESGLRYTEDTSRSTPGMSVRDCCLWLDGVDEPVSDLNVLSFRQRFGSVTVPAEGIGGVETLPAYRRRGYNRILWTKAIAEIAKRVPVIFVANGIEGLYEKYGFVGGLANGHLSVPVRNVERMAGTRTPTPQLAIRGFTQDDLPAIISLFNAAHATRTWSHVRPAAWNQLRVRETWRPGSDVIIAERDGQVAGYAIMNEVLFGHELRPFTVDEMTAVDIEVAEALLIDVAARCWQLRLSEFRLFEPPDSVVGIAARRLGCTSHLTSLGSGGMMGAIADRLLLLQMLEPELRRRLPSDELRADHATAFEALSRGEVIVDDRDLLRLLVGYWSAAEARALSVEISGQYHHVCEAWFPGATSFLPLPYAHTLDRY